MIRFISALAVTLSIAATLSPAVEASTRERLETETIPGSFITLGAGQTRSLPLRGGWRYVQKLYIRAEGAGARDGMFEVYANGDAKGTIFVPGRDPSYVVTIGEHTQSIELRHTSGGSVWIRGIHAVVSPDSVHMPVRDDSKYGIYRPARGRIASISVEAMNLVDELWPYSSTEDYLQFLLPIKKAAGRTYALVRGRGEHSEKTRTALLALRAQIHCAEAFIDDAFGRESTFELGVALLQLRESIDDLLD